MQYRAVFVALLLVLATGPALAGGVAAQPSSIADTTSAMDHADFDCEFPVEVEDGMGETVTIDEEPETVVVLYPNVAQHMWEIGAQEKVIGMPVNENTDYLEGSEDRTHILTEGEGGFMVPDTELIVDLEPDLVLSPNVTPEDAVQELRDAEQTVFHYPIAGNFEDVQTLVERTGQLVGACEGANAVTGEMGERIDLVEQATADVEQPRTFYDLGFSFTVNDQGFEHEVLTTAGADNIAADIEAEFGGGYPEISDEELIDRNPEVVVASLPPSLLDDPQTVVTTDVSQEMLSDITGYEETDALENDRVIGVNSNFISQHAPRTVDVLEAIADELHPEAMEDARQSVEGDADDADDSTADDGTADGDETDATDDDADATDDTDATDDDTDTTDDADDATVGEDDSDADDSGPGLTVGAAVAALVALTLLARRR